MKIECIAKTTGTVRTPIGNEIYEFRADAKGRKVCEVWIEPHIKAFLALTGVYREAKDEPEANKANKANKEPVAAAPVPFDNDGDGKPDAVFDHNGDGKPGGSLPKAKRGKKARRK